MYSSLAVGSGDDDYGARDPVVHSLLASFAERGPPHGRRLRLEAERKRVHVWTDLSVGVVYGAMKRRAAEGLPRAVGRFPSR